uniref:ATP-dependent Zn protease n=1 Tax=Heterosigma akashiwo TaxID=2829 RepID=A0A224APN1_HETAK|nr:ATP-dependent Zn protease [Heterosigma akashiwo]BBA18402.1 ATP-dependent Zn protease [Heterosigma akashiwo]BBA18541.1 ATP-dependent Zn protease [Heterosigma akashiwo]BBA18679.1 ATP-dependent Zn protease [Heterosigma akashiwo]BBA18818.1 ATP-dependent Zn protease [Heterosigma akashiwo]
MSTHVLVLLEQGLHFEHYHDFLKESQPLRVLLRDRQLTFYFYYQQLMALLNPQLHVQWLMKFLLTQFLPFLHEH